MYDAWATLTKETSGTVGTVVRMQIRGKTEQRVANVIQTLRRSKVPLSYEALQAATGANYDSLLYILATLAEVGQVERFDLPDGPGRPRVHFRWIGGKGRAQATGA